MALCAYHYNSNTTMKLKQDRRAKIKKRILSRLSGTAQRPRMAVYKSNQRIYAMLIDDDVQKTLTSVSSAAFDKGSKDAKTSINIEKSKKVGEMIGDKAKKMGITEVVFDRSGYQYHGKVKSLADGARSQGIKF